MQVRSLVRPDFVRAAFVRDPLDRFLSAYHFVYTLNGKEQIKEVRTRAWGVGLR
jgi:hypothetical protein